MFSKLNTSPANPARSEKKRLNWQKARRRLFWTLAVAFVAHATLNIYASIQLNHELEAIRAKGEPLQLAEMESPAVPDAQNAALVYQRATASIKYSQAEKVAFKSPRRSLTPQQEVDLTAALQKNQLALALTRRAAAMPQCKFPIDWSGNPLHLNPAYFGQLRDLAKLLADQSEIDIEQGHDAEALQNVRAIFGISHHLSNEPTLIGFLVGQSINSMGNGSLALLLEKSPLTVAQAHALLASLPPENLNQAYRHSLLGERTFGFFIFENVGVASLDQINASSKPSWRPNPLLYLWRPILKLDEVQSLRIWQRMLDAPEAQQIPSPPEFVQSLDQAIQHTPRYAVMTRLVTPSFSTSRARDKAEVRRRQREVALALAGYRSAHGSYPASLQEAASLWGKALPLDPYSGKAFIYRREGNSFRLYSIGPNMVDEKGQDRHVMGKSPNSFPDDISWPNALASRDKEIVRVYP